MDYLDFEIEIEAGVGREYPVAVIASPAGEARETMRLPFDRLELENRLQALQIALLRSGGKRRVILTPEEQSVQEFGRSLFDALLTGEVRSRYDVSRREAVQRGMGLRLKLRVQSPELASLPWEFMYDVRLGEYVCLSRNNPIVRYIEVPQPLKPLAVDFPLRILGMIASPDDQPSLDVERERGRVDQAVGSLTAAGLVELTWLAGQTWRQLQEALQEGPFHVFHFIGHGGFDPHLDEGLIALAGEDGLAYFMTATQLGRMLADHTSLRLVLLNACEGARGSRGDIFSSAATILVRRGIPAVIAMQYEITDQAAIEFARTFYRSLSTGLPVDAAVAEARKAISFAVNNTFEWGTPVLYLRAPDGRIFELTKPAPETPAARPIPRVRAPALRADPELEARLEKLYIEGLAQFHLEAWDQAAQRFRAITDLNPEYRDAAARLAQADRQFQLGELYDQALAAQAAEDWGTAEARLDELMALDPAYRDATALREQISRQGEVARLYLEAQQLYEAGKWQAVGMIFVKLSALEPDFPDPHGLQSSAQAKLVEAEKRSRVAQLYQDALAAMDVGQWDQAGQLLAQVQELEPGHGETERLQARVAAELEREQRERDLQQQAHQLADEAGARAEKGDWLGAREALAELRGLDPHFTGESSLAEQVDAQLAAALEARYRQGLDALEAGRWAQAQEHLSRAAVIDPENAEIQQLLARARSRLADPGRVPPEKTERRRSRIGWVPRWGRIGAALVLAAGAALVIWQLAGSPGEEPPSDQLASVIEAEWATSAHADQGAEAFTHWDNDDPPVVPINCAKCHTTPGFLDFLGADGSPAGGVDVDAPVGTVITCEACHNLATETLDRVVMPSGVEISGLGAQAVCLQCHQGRESGASVKESIADLPLDEVSDRLVFLNIHYFAAGATRYGAQAGGAYEYPGRRYVGFFEHAPEAQQCTQCHLPHVFKVVATLCADCHPGVSSENDLPEIRVSGTDWDGDGDAKEGLSREVSTLRHRLYQAIQAYASQYVGVGVVYDDAVYPYFFTDTNANGWPDQRETVPENRYNTWTPRLLQAAYNYQFVSKDPGGYTHNGRYLLQIMYDSLEDLSADVSDLIRP